LNPSSTELLPGSSSSSVSFESGAIFSNFEHNGATISAPSFTTKVFPELSSSIGPFESVSSANNFPAQPNIHHGHILDNSNPSFTTELLLELSSSITISGSEPTANNFPAQSNIHDGLDNSNPPSHSATNLATLIYNGENIHGTATFSVQGNYGDCINIPTSNQNDNLDTVEFDDANCCTLYFDEQCQYLFQTILESLTTLDSSNDAPGSIACFNQPCVSSSGSSHNGHGGSNSNNHVSSASTIVAHTTSPGHARPNIAQENSIVVVPGASPDAIEFSQGFEEDAITSTSLTTNVYTSHHHLTTDIDDFTFVTTDQNYPSPSPHSIHLNYISRSTFGGQPSQISVGIDDSVYQSHSEGHNLLVSPTQNPGPTSRLNFVEGTNVAAAEAPGTVHGSDNHPVKPQFANVPALNEPVTVYVTRVHTYSCCCPRKTNNVFSTV
jgi:hypothetical protein